jgi:LmbE family N-acetylglucosaminyl deacetylase
MGRSRNPKRSEAGRIRGRALEVKERVLVISAHCDDESFGCLGTLLIHKKEKAQFAFLWFAHARDTQIGARKVWTYFDARQEVFSFPDQEFDSVKLKSFISVIEDALDDFKPTVVYCPFIADLNKDHRIIAEATMVACRPYLSNAPKEVWMYEIPGTTELGLRKVNNDKVVEIDWMKKTELINKWYPKEMIHGREWIQTTEFFERWPRI